MRFLFYTAPTPAEDLALEEAIHLAVETGVAPMTWRLWSARAPAVVLGTGQEAAREANVPQAQQRGVQILRRHSGGGAVVIGPGTINFSVFFPYEEMPGSETIRGATHTALQPVMDLLKNWALKPSEAGYSDLALLCADGTLRKIAGNSQARKKNSAVVHGTLLADPDWERIGAVLNFPTSVPDYRANREHRAFLTCLREQGAPHSIEAFRDSLLTALRSPLEWTDRPAALELERAAELVREKYAQETWTFRR
jgi:lipoate---protein ligase